MQLIESFEDKIENDIKQVLKIINKDTVNYEDSKGKSLLYKASEQGDKEVVQFLVDL